MQLGTYFVSFKFVVDLFHASSWEPAPPFRQLRASPMAWSVAKNLACVHCCQIESPRQGFGPSGQEELNCSARQRGTVCPNLRGFCCVFQQRFKGGLADKVFAGPAVI